MKDKGWLLRSFMVGAVTAPLLLCASQHTQMLSDAAALRGLPATFISNPFLDITTLSGRKVSIGGTWLLVILALSSGILSTSLTGFGRVLLNTFKRL